jgi:hypothetical protein
VEFFSSEGRRLGDKTSLGELVHEIAGIPFDVLEGRPLKNYSRHDRMAWAENRKTTEPEDRVYCLLVILDISLLTSYGEGEKTARTRLNDELASGNVTLYSIPFARNLQFVGRESELDWLEAQLFQDEHIAANQTAILAITGAGGTGKSQLALELAYRTKKRYGGCSVF